MRFQNLMEVYLSITFMTIAFAIAAYTSIVTFIEIRKERKYLNAREKEKL